MIMFGQHAPRMDFFAVGSQCFQQPFGKIAQPFRMQANDGAMFVTSSRQQITSVLVGLMLGTVPGAVIEATKFKQFFTLFLVKLSPEIHCWNCVGVQTLVCSVFISLEPQRAR